MKVSSQAFFRWGGQHAQFLGVVGVFCGGLVLVGSKINHWGEEVRNIRIEMNKEVALLQKELETEAATRRAELEAANARVAQARAEAIQQTADRFLQYGYAEEYSKYRKKALGDKE